MPAPVPPIAQRMKISMPRRRAPLFAAALLCLAWVAEAESSLNPSARSPVGAKGLFQFMPETAKAMEASTKPTPVPTIRKGSSWSERSSASGSCSIDG